MNVAESSVSKEEDFSAVIKLMERLAQVERFENKDPADRSSFGNTRG
jgi:hypothetical protein